MTFSAQPLIPGDLHDGAVRLAREAAQELARLSKPAERAAALGRLWTRVEELQWPSLMRPEVAGGADGALEDLVALIDGAAREALALPLATMCGVAPVLLQAVEPARWPGDGVAPCPVLDAYALWLQPTETPRATIGAHGVLQLSGAAAAVETPLAPDSYLVACPVEHDDGAEPGLLLIQRGELPRPPRLFERVDGRLVADISFAGLVLPPDKLLARGAAVEQAVAAATDRGAFLSCVEAQATLGTALERLIAYLSDRKQFGVPLSTFQALRHAVAELYVVYETLRAMVVHLLGAAGPNGALPSREVALAKLHVGRVARRAAETMIQLHGGMGMAEELPATPLGKRLLMVEFEFGDAAWHARRLLHDAETTARPREFARGPLLETVP